MVVSFQWTQRPASVVLVTVVAISIVAVHTFAANEPSRELALPPGSDDSNAKTTIRSQNMVGVVPTKMGGRSPGQRWSPASSAAVSQITGWGRPMQTADSS